MWFLTGILESIHHPDNGFHLRPYLTSSSCQLVSLMLIRILVLPMPPDRLQQGFIPPKVPLALYLAEVVYTSPYVDDLISGYG